MCKHLEVCELHQEIDGENAIDILADLRRDTEKMTGKDSEFVTSVCNRRGHLTEPQLKWIRDISRRIYA
jgi:hypothetical protein